ncbi:hypothetical protein R3P38DRAFT_3560018 [Favolaschia claudopus]|uniref:NADP-dependent oxidoreductase domain-containing protein n=1 Tax=Favolaschia claudopus TaxID=2862362 RepID=A0AAW0AW28_9AGAR
MADFLPLDRQAKRLPKLIYSSVSVTAAAKVAGCTPAELAYRWVAFDSVVDSKYGDAVIFGVRNYTQIEETMGWLKAGTIGQAAKDKIDEIWKVVEKDSPLDNYNSFHKQAPVAAQ